MSTTLEAPPLAPVPTLGASRPGPVTPEDLLAMPDGKAYELVDGHLVERNVGQVSSLVGLELGAEIRNFAKAGGLGWVFGSDLGYRCFPHKPGKVRRADASFIRRERLPAEELKAGFCSLAPDLAVEVVSPNDLAVDVEAKILDYLAAGVPLVWVVYPEARAVHVRRGDGTVSHLLPGGELDGGAVLPGFRLRVDDLFAGLPDPPPSPDILPDRDA